MPTQDSARRVQLICRNCGIEFSKPLSQANRPYHSRVCFDDAVAKRTALFARVDSSGGPTACWPCKGSPDADGYIHISVDGKLKLAHREAWKQANGPIPELILVCHRCDNPPCCNIQHLFLGTDADNNADKESKGRGNHPFGSHHGRARLSEFRVQEIRAAYAAGGISQTMLATKFGVSQITISRIVRITAWTHVSQPNV